MAHVSEPLFEVVHALRLKGFAEPPGVAEASTLEEADVWALLDGLAHDALAERREGRISGWTLTPAGRERHVELLETERSRAGCGEALEVAYKRFLSWNDAVKSLCTDWQIRVIEGQQVMNDHSDPAYDAAIVERLGEVHGQAAALIEDVSAALARMAPYGVRFDNAWQRFSSGDHAALAKPLSGSYHDVWMELHTDLLLLLGRERSEADGH